MFGNEIFRRVHCGMTPGEAAGEVMLPAVSVRQPRLLREQSRNPFEMNLIHRADGNLTHTHTTGVEGILALLEINTIYENTSETLQLLQFMLHYTCNQYVGGKFNDMLHTC